jgi:hypothetical protein
MFCPDIASHNNNIIQKYYILIPTKKIKSLTVNTYLHLVTLKVPGNIKFTVLVSANNTSNKDIYLTMISSTSSSLRRPKIVETYVRVPIPTKLRLKV